MAKPPTPPEPERIRLTITVSPEVHATFTRMANATGMSLGRAMGEWLGDTIEAAEFLAAKLEEAKAAPRRVVQELHAMSLGNTEMLEETLQKMRRERASAAGTGGDALRAPRPAPTPAPPRPVIRGGKSTTTGRKPGKPRGANDDHHHG